MSCLDWIAPIVSILAALTSWFAIYIPYRAKKALLTVNVSVEKYPIMRSSLGGMPAVKDSEWSLVIKIINYGERVAENIKVVVTCHFKNADTPCEKMISGDLVPNEETRIFLPLQPVDAGSEKNYIKISLAYNDVFFKKRHYQRESTWYFNVRDQQLVSENLHRVV